MADYTRNNGGVCNGEWDLCIGLDVDKRSICVVVHDGRGVVRSLKMPYDPEILLSFASKQYGGKRLIFAYEAGPTGFGLYDAIVDGGHECLVVSPANVPCAANGRVKTNRLDARKLATLLSGRQLKGIRVPPPPIRELRSLVQLRYTYMQDIRAYKCRIKSELLKEGVKFPDAAKGSQWSGRVMEKLRTLECEVVTSFKINSILDHIEHLARQMNLTEVALKSLVNGNEDLRSSIEYLMSCPGIGWRIACYSLSRIGDWRVLGSSKEAGAFFGLVPSENSTGDDTDRGPITKCGDPRLRSMLIQGAWTAIHRDCELNSLYERIRASHTEKYASRVAIVAVARKLAERMHCVLREQRHYEPRAVGLIAA